MSTIKLEFESEDNAAVTAVAALTDSLLGKTNIFAKKLAETKVTDAEEVKPPTTSKPRPSRAKAKPEPEPETEEEEEETSDDVDPDFEEEETEEIGIEDVRAIQAEKIGKNKPAIIAALKKFGATGISSLDEKHYKAYYDILGKLE